MDEDRCPQTGEYDCTRCSGEYCETHTDRPCDCDVVQRHDLGKIDLDKGTSDA